MTQPEAQLGKSSNAEHTLDPSPAKKVATTAPVAASAPIGAWTNRVRSRGEEEEAWQDNEPWGSGMSNLS